MRVSGTRIVGEGSLLVHALGIYPIGLELSVAPGGDYPIGRNILFIMVFFCVPYLTCLSSSHPLYEKTTTRAPISSCILSLAMSATSALFLFAAYNGGEKGIIMIPIIILQNIFGVIAFRLLRYVHRDRA